MLKVKNKYDYRQELCEALRTTKKLKGTGKMYNSITNRYCALGVFATEVLNWELDKNSILLAEYPDSGYTPLEEKLELRGVWAVNDTSVSFEQVAHWIENQS